MDIDIAAEQLEAAVMLRIGRTYTLVEEQALRAGMASFSHGHAAEPSPNRIKSSFLN
jgi:hypothetical protein